MRALMGGVLFGALLSLTPAHAVTVTQANFDCGDGCNVKFADIQTNVNLITGYNDNGLEVTYQSTDKISTQGVGQAGIVGAGTTGLYTNLWWTVAPLGYTNEGFTVEVSNGATGQPQSGWLKLAITNDSNVIDTNYFLVTELSNKFTLTAEGLELIYKVEILGIFTSNDGTDVASPVQISAFKQDRIFLDDDGGGGSSPVPLPAGIVLLGSVLIGGTGLAAIRRRRRIA